MKKTASFEDNLRQLEQILQELEDGDLPLEAALEKFETGIRLIKLCNQQLDAMEQRVEILLRDEAGDLVAKPFAPLNQGEGESS